jgi:hypothetical protein
MLKFSDFNEQGKILENTDPTQKPAKPFIKKKLVDEDDIGTNKDIESQEDLDSIKEEDELKKKNKNSGTENHPDLAVEKKVFSYGKLLSFKTNPKDAIQLLENYNLSKDKCWYYMIEQAEEIHVVKYNEQATFRMRDFINALFSHYIKNNIFVQENVQSIKVAGNDNFVVIKNISDDMYERIKNDLIVLLSK